MADIIDYKEAKAFIEELNALSAARRENILHSPTTLTVSGTSYYISADGDDTADGLTPETAWKTTEKLNASASLLKPGDGVFFRRGDMFRGGFCARGGITYSAYGEGAKPIITGSPENAADPAKWSLMEGSENIWVFERELIDVGTIILDDGERGAAYRQAPDLLGGVFYVPQTNQTVKFEIEKHLQDLQFISWIDTPNMGLCKEGKLYFRCDAGNPGDVFRSMELCLKGSIITTAGDYINIDNLCIKYVGKHGIGSGSITGLHVTNCEVCWIGGSIHYYRPEHYAVRLGNGIEIYGQAQDYLIDNCYVHDCFDAGITHQFGAGTEDCSMVDIQYSNNLIEDCSYNIEYFNDDSLDKTAVRNGRNVNIFGNILRRAGYGYGVRRARVVPCANFVTWMHRNEYVPGTFRIHDNILDRSSRMLIKTYAKDDSWYPVFDHNTYVLVDGVPLGTYVGGEYAYEGDMKARVPEILGDKNAVVYIAGEEFAYKE